jgi:hypothetical protein
MSTPETRVTVENRAFFVNGRPTYAGRWYGDRKVEGLLMNARLVQGIFDDLSPATRTFWDYPDGSWDPDRNTDEFVAQMAGWRASGLLGFTINLQGGSPQGYSQHQPWHNSAFTETGDLRPAYMDRLARILDEADRLGMIAILGYFYFGQDQRLREEQSVIKATEHATDWLLERGYAHVLVEIANEVDNSKYDHAILRPGRCAELIDLVKVRSRGAVATAHGRLLVSTSLCGGVVPPEHLVAVSDYLLLHGNGVSQPEGIRAMVDGTREVRTYSDQPVLFNEDDHFGFGEPDNNMLAAVDRYAGWGYFDYRMTDEDYHEGYQSVPVDWSTNSARKRGFFELLAKITGAR